jgi:hypothetical protein
VTVIRTPVPEEHQAEDNHTDEHEESLTEDHTSDIDELMHKVVKDLEYSNTTIRLLGGSVIHRHPVASRLNRSGAYKGLIEIAS